MASSYMDFLKGQFFDDDVPRVTLLLDRLLVHI